MRYLKHLAAFLLAYALAFNVSFAAGSLRVQNTASGTTGTITSQLTGVQTGDLLAVCIYERDGNSVTTPSDDVNGTWSLGATRSATAARSALYYFKNSAAGNPTVSLTISGTSPRDMTVMAFSGMATTGGTDASNSAGNSSTTSQTHGSITPSASALVIACLGIGSAHGGITQNSGFTALNIDAGASSQRQNYAYKVSHTGAINVTETTTNSVSSDAVVAAFLESAGSSCTNQGWIPSTGNFGSVTASSTNVYRKDGTTGTVNCSSTNYWQKGGAFGTN